jgi:hypothetical protein
MVVLTNEALPYEYPALTKRCFTCREMRWRAEYPHIYARRCLPCSEGVKKARCAHCGGPAALDTRGLARKFCDLPECRDASHALSTAASVEARMARARGGMHTCAVCGIEKEKNRENFTPQRRGPNGEVVKWQAWCRPCVRADRRARYASDPEVRRRVAERDARRRAEHRQRRAVDPEYIAEFRRHKAEMARKRYWERKRAEAQPKPRTSSGGTGPNMIAWPLMDVVDAYIQREGIDEEAAAFRLGTTARRFNDWRRPGHSTRMSLIDRALLGLGLEWDQVYPPLWFPEIAKHWQGR